MKKYFIISFLLLAANLKPSFSCDCKENSYEKLRQISFESADIVFLGKLKSSDPITETFEFNVLEVFKGNNHQKEIKGRADITSCDLLPSDSGLWIVYAHFTNDTAITISSCGLSRSMMNPDRPMFYWVDPPRPLPSVDLTEQQKQKSEQETLKYKARYYKAKFNALQDWIIELEDLRRKHK